MADERGMPTQKPPVPEGEGQEIKARSVVAVRLDALKNRKLRNLAPIRLIMAGWRNEFLVQAVHMIEGMKHLTLYPCCFWMIDRRTGDFLCKCHPAEFFEPLALSVRERKPGDRQSWITTPWGPIVDMDYQDDEGAPVMTFRAFGFPIQISGGLAQKFLAAFKEAGLVAK